MEETSAARHQPGVKVGFIFLQDSWFFKAQTLSIKKLLCNKNSEIFDRILICESLNVRQGHAGNNWVDVESLACMSVQV